MNYHKYLFPLLLAIGLPLSAQNASAQIADTFGRGLLQTQFKLADALERGILQTQIGARAAQSTLAKSVFRAYPEGQEDTHAFSGFVFKTMYQGKEEIFGVIAQHAVPLRNGDGRIGKNFTARVLANGQVKDIPAEIVQFTSPAFLDVALVKFRSEDEPLLTPLPLAEQDPAMGDELQTIGFATEQLILSPTILLKNTLISLRFPLGIPYVIRPGLCGSPVLNSAGEVVGVFTGNTGKADDYWGFATKSSYLRPVVAAYHNDLQNATFPLMLGEHKIADLKPDEYVSWIRLDDDERYPLLNQVVDYKFPHSKVMRKLPDARYVRLIINKVKWTGYELKEYSFGGTHITYDLKEKEIIQSDR